TGRGSSPGVGTIRRRSGTREVVPRSSPSRGTPIKSIRRRSAPTDRGSSPGVPTIRRRPGTREVVPSSSPSRGTPRTSIRRRSAPTGRGSSPGVWTRRLGRVDELSDHHQGGRQVDERQERFIELVITGGHPAELLQPVEQPLHLVPLPVLLLVIADRL